MLLLLALLLAGSQAAVAGEDPCRVQREEAQKFESAAYHVLRGDGVRERNALSFCEMNARKARDVASTAATKAEVRESARDGWALLYCVASSKAHEKEAAFYGSLKSNPSAAKQEYPAASDYESAAQSIASVIASKFGNSPPDCAGSRAAELIACAEQVACRTEPSCVDADRDRIVSSIGAVRTMMEDRIVIFAGLPCEPTPEQRTAARIAQESRDPKYAVARYLEICMPEYLEQRIAKASKTKPSQATRERWRRAMEASRTMASRAVQDLKDHRITGGFRGCRDEKLEAGYDAIACAYREVPADLGTIGPDTCRFGPAVDTNNSVREGERP